MGNLTVTNLRCEHQRSPLGLDEKEPRFSWELVSDERNVRQAAYRVVVKDSEKEVWNSGRIESEESIEVAYQGANLEAMTGYRFLVTVWDNKGNMASQESTFETGRLSVPWKSKWVEPIQEPNPQMDSGFLRI